MPESEAIRIMDNEQFIYFCLYVLAFGVVQVGLAYFVSYFTKNAELKAINETLADVTKKTKRIERDVDFIADQQSDLIKEKRKALFDFHYALNDWLHHLSAVIPDVSSSSNDFQAIANEKYSYILLTRSRYSLLFPGFIDIDVPMTSFLMTGIEYQKITAILQDALNGQGVNHQQLLHQYGLDRTSLVEVMYSEMGKLDIAFRKLIEHTKKLRT